MPNFGLIRLTIFTYVCVQVLFLAYCAEIEPVDIYPWKVEEDELKVEKIVLEYAKTRETSPNLLQRMFSKLIRNTPATDTRLLVDFNEFSDEDKLFMCTAILRLNYFGLEYLMTDDYNMKITPQEIALKNSHSTALDTKIISMYQCPKLQYIDLETEEPTPLSIKYFISGTHARDSFLLYLQEASDLPIHPHKYASEVKLAAFDEIRVTYELAEKEDKLNIEKMRVHSEVPEIEERLTKFMDSTKSTKVYEKFRYLFKSLVLCGMPRIHLIAVCRYIAHILDLEVEHRGYDESRCRKREVSSKPGESEDSKSVFLGRLYMVKCPALSSEVDGNINKFSIETMFIAANQWSQSVLVLKRRNLRGENVIPEVTMSALRLHMLKKDRNRIRELLKPGYIERKPRYFDLTTELIRLSGLRIDSGPPSITFRRSVVEDQTIIFMRLKASKMPYDRFSAAYNSININMWPTKDVDFLCQLILQDQSYNLDLKPDLTTGAKSENQSRSPIQVQLAMRDAELLNDENTIARRCPPGFQPSSTHFIVSTIHKDAITVHVQYEKVTYAFPEAYVENIDKVEIQAVTRNTNIFPSITST